MDEAEVRKIIRDEIQLASEGTLHRYTLTNIPKVSALSSDDRPGQIVYWDDGASIQRICVTDPNRAWRCADIDYSL